MAIKRQDPVLKAMRKHFIIRMRDLKVYKEDFDYQNMEWILSGNIHSRPIEIGIQLEENLMWINLKVLDVDMVMTKEQMRELTDECLSDPIRAEFNDQDNSDDGTWYMTYLIRFKNHNVGMLIEKMKLLAERVIKTAGEEVA